MNAAASARLRALAAQAGVGVLIEVGHREGMFDKLDEVVTAAELAARCRVSVELARDWLDGLVLAKLVEYDGRRDTYALLADARAALTLLDEPPLELFGESDQRVVTAAALGPAPLEALRALAASMEHGEVLTLVELRAADSVADNLDHPLGPALYASSLRRRQAGRAGVIGEARVWALMAAAGFSDLAVAPLGTLHIAVRGARR
jgi:hypothetical protein